MANLIWISLKKTVFLLLQYSGSKVFSLKCQFIGLYFILVLYYCWRPVQCISNILVIIVFQSTTTLSTTITLPWQKKTILCNVYPSGVIFLFPPMHKHTNISMITCIYDLLLICLLVSWMLHNGTWLIFLHKSSVNHFMQEKI